MPHPFPFSQLFQNMPDQHRVFRAGDNPFRTLALLAGFDVNVEQPLQGPDPGHGGVALGWRSFILVGGCLFFPNALAPRVQRENRLGPIPAPAPPERN